MIWLQVFPHVTSFFETPMFSRSTTLVVFCLTLGCQISGNAQETKDTFVGLERVFPQLRFHRPVFLTGAGDGTGRIFVTEQAGLIHVFSPNKDPENNPVTKTKVFLDIRDRISRVGNEEGLIGLAFHPDYKNNGEFFVHYSSSVKDMTGIISRFRISENDPDKANPDSEEQILEQSQPYRNHNGGTIAFGKDGYLYASLGDGGKANDPHDHGQNLNSWLGSIIRIDIDHQDEGKAYAVPKDNPFVDRPDALPELWAIGLRNVWRFSFDRETDELWAGDVGQDRFDEVSIIKRGGNYGWNRYEAKSDFKKDAVMATREHDEPVTFYGREWGLSITGGNVYRGKRYPSLVGAYFYGDYVSGNLWRVSKNSEGQYENELVRRTGRSIASFGEDDEGELYLLSFDGGIYRIVPTEQPEDTFDDWPTKLSETGLYTSVKDHRVSDELIPYSLNAPFWSDGAAKERFILLPAGGKLEYRETGSWGLPVGSTIVKNFKDSRNRMLETRLIKRTDEGWEAASYVWDYQRNRSATLRPAGQQFEVYSPDRARRRWNIDSWHAPSASECASCHVDAAGYVLGLNTAQLNMSVDGKNQILTWKEQGVVELPENFDAEKANRFCSPTDESAELNERARVYLDVNCAMCHRPEGPGNANIDLRYATDIEKTGMINQPPAQGDLGNPDSRIILPGNPDNSTLLHRVETLGPGRMPNIGSNKIDENAVQLLKAWINSLD